MNSAKNIFLDAARQGRACHINVHMEASLIKCIRTIEVVHRAFEQSKIVTRALSNNTPSLITTLDSPSLIATGPLDQVITHNDCSAIAGPEQKAFLKKHNISTSLISGMSAEVCVQDTMNDCSDEGIIPIMIMDAINLEVFENCATQDNYHEFQQAAHNLWGDDVLTASTAEICDWVQELS